ncbi:ATP-dependent 6-phosphofructokinase [Geminicoccus harenae]|uniref:ATP-dependent 6-phosphofructokinase n=1 Tax=Geminicoccus harenae TaxID=2498453 RepID=UPI00168BE415|nr:ATP-dependent 6-phosphofructokinase [Geminicoccus harenae]
MRLGVLTSGGDCAGLNAVIRAVMLRAVYGHGMELYGIHEATHGLLRRPVTATRLTSDTTRGILHLGGTILGTTNRGNPFAYPVEGGGTIDRSAEIIQGYHELGLDALIGIGGDGSLAILRKLALAGGWNLVGVPKTIDNDVDLTEHAVGHSTAVEIATEAVDRLHVTAASHNRVMVLEVMGRDAGYIALSAGIAGGADVVLIPEIPYRIESVCAKIEERRRIGRNFSLIVVAESVKSPEGMVRTVTDAHGQSRYGGIGRVIAEEVAKRTGAESRVTVLGHVQRGGSPTPLDRVVASAFGVAAVDLVAKGEFDRMVAWQDRKVVAVPLAKATAGTRAVDLNDTLLHTARGLGISFGEPG